MTRKSTGFAGTFPSDKLLELLTDIQINNGKIRKEELFDRDPKDFRSTINEVIQAAIQSTIYIAKHEDRLTNVPLSLDDDNVFTAWFATRLIKALTPIVGTIPDGKDDAVLHFLYQELSPIGIHHQITNGNYVFAYSNNQYMVRLHAPLAT